MHPLAWLGWLAAGALVTLSTRNPLYLLVLFSSFNLVLDVERTRQGPDGTPTLQSPEADRGLTISPLRFAVFAIPAGAVFNLLTSRVGETVLLRVPSAVPLLSGPFTLEAFVYGAINGLLLVTLFAAFAVLNVAVSIRDLIAYIPRAFYPVAIVSAIAVTFVPNTVRQFRQVKEAQAIRGHEMRGWRDWLPLFLPVLIGGLERALELAEAMTARGFGGATGADKRRGVGPALVAGLACLLVAGVAQLFPDWVRWAPVFLIAGTVLIGWTIWIAGRSVRHTRYRRPTWRITDSLVIVTGCLVIVPLLVLGGGRAYSPYPALSWPSFDLRVGPALLLLTTPGFVRGLGRAVGPLRSSTA